ncbi:hypothetical protein, partial [Aeromonas hydrophila]
AFTSVATDKFDVYLIPLDNKRQFVDTLIDVGENINLRHEIGRNAYNTAEEFSLEKMIENYGRYYSTKISMLKP